jgi:hypothetical protein
MTSGALFTSMLATTADSFSFASVDTENKSANLQVILFIPSID